MPSPWRTRVRPPSPARPSSLPRPGVVLDILFDIVATYTENRKAAKKFLKDLIKVAIKVGLLYRHNQFTGAEMALVNKFRRKFKFTILTMIRCAAAGPWAPPQRAQRTRRIAATMMWPSRSAKSFWSSSF